MNHRKSKPLRSIVLQNRTWLVACFQALLIFASLVLAWFLRFDFSLPDRVLLFSAAPLLIAIRLAAIGKFGLLHGWWRYTGVSDALDIFKAITLGSVVFLFVMRFLLGVTAFPRTIYVLEAVSVWACWPAFACSHVSLLNLYTQLRHRHQKVMLIGAGMAAQMVIREIKRLPESYEAVGCVDDDRSKLGIKIHGVPVIGNVEQLPALLTKHPVDEVLIAVPSATGKQMQRFVRHLRACWSQVQDRPRAPRHHHRTGDRS